MGRKLRCEVDEALQVAKSKLEEGLGIVRSPHRMDR